MSRTRKITLLMLGFVAAILLVSQVVLGQLIVFNYTNLKKAHQHTGYTTVVVSLLYVGVSLSTIASLSTRPKV